MARNLSRLFSPNLNSAKPNLGLSIAAENLSAEAAAAARRLLCSSALPRQDVPRSEGAPQQAKGDEDSQNPEEDDGEEGEGEGGAHVNQETGEVGGPRGPEPTRFGDWEQKGRCSDF